MKIYVGNMPFRMSDCQTRSLFEEFGDGESVNVITDRHAGRPRGFAFVEMHDEPARKSISALHQREVDGRKLNISEAPLVKTAAEADAEDFRSFALEKGTKLVTDTEYE